MNLYRKKEKDGPLMLPGSSKSLFWRGNSPARWLNRIRMAIHLSSSVILSERMEISGLSLHTWGMQRLHRHYRRSCPERKEGPRSSLTPNRAKPDTPVLNPHRNQVHSIPKNQVHSIPRNQVHITLTVQALSNPGSPGEMAPESVWTEVRVVPRPTHK